MSLLSQLSIVQKFLVALAVDVDGLVLTGVTTKAVQVTGDCNQVLFQVMDDSRVSSGTRLNVYMNVYKRSGKFKPMSQVSFRPVTQLLFATNLPQVQSTCGLLSL